MNMLTSYEQAMAALSTALSSEQVDVVLKGRDDLNHVKLHAKQVRDRALLADATEFQMRVERWLGVLLMRAKDEGHLQRRARPKMVLAGRNAPVTLKEIGVDRKLSMKAQHAAALDQPAFDAAVSEMRSHMAGGKAKLVSAVVDAQKAKRKPSRGHSSFDFVLADGTPLGQVRLGKLRVRIELLRLELKILVSIGDRIGSADALASVAESFSDTALGQIIERAKSEH
jgi:hypothetical protein